jgi:hypothetical protein
LTDPISHKSGDLGGLEPHPLLPGAHLIGNKSDAKDSSPLLPQAHQIGHKSGDLGWPEAALLLLQGEEGAEEEEEGEVAGGVRVAFMDI